MKMVDNAPSLDAFVEVQKGFDKAVHLLRKEDRQQKLKLVESDVKIVKLEEQVDECELKLKKKEKEEKQNVLKIEELQQQIDEMKIREENKIHTLKNELEKRRCIIEELTTDQNNSNELDDLKAQAKDKSKLIRSLKKRVKIFDEVLAKKQEEHKTSLKTEKEAQLVLRKKLNALKNGTQTADTDDEIRLVKKKYKEEVRLMRKNIEDYEARVKKMNAERFEWESEKKKCKEDLKILLEDYAQRGDLLTACQAKVEKYKQHEEEHHKNFDSLKELYETLEKKYKDTFSEKRAEYVGMIKRVESLEVQNKTLVKSLSRSNTKYESLLLLDSSHQEIIEQNEELNSRIHDIEEWFDEAWAGFRLEVLNFEQKLEQKNKIIRKLKGETAGKETTLFRQTESGIFCLQAMKELQEKFQSNDRPEWYMKAVKQLIFECSIQQKQNVETEEKESNEMEGKCEQIPNCNEVEVEETSNECSDGDQEQKDCGKVEFKGNDPASEVDESAVQQQRNDDEEYEDDFEQDESLSSSAQSVSEEMSDEQHTSDSAGESESNIDSTAGAGDESSSCSNASVSDDVGELEKESEGNDNAACSYVKVETPQSTVDDLAESPQSAVDVGSTTNKPPKELGTDSNDIQGEIVEKSQLLQSIVTRSTEEKVAGNITVPPKSAEKELAKEVPVLANSNDGFAELKDEVVEYKEMFSAVIAHSSSSAKVHKTDILASQTTNKPSNLRRRSSQNVAMKSVSFNKTVDLQYFDEQNAPMTKNNEFVDILKAAPTQANNAETAIPTTPKPAPVRKVYKNIPEYHPIKPITSQRLPKLNKIPPKLSTGDNVKQEKITAADIFGSFSTKAIDKTVDVDDDDDNLFDLNNMDDTMDFLLNM